MKMENKFASNEDYKKYKSLLSEAKMFEESGETEKAFKLCLQADVYLKKALNWNGEKGDCEI
jgi:hypothetical protein